MKCKSLIQIAVEKTKKNNKKKKHIGARFKTLNEPITAPLSLNEVAINEALYQTQNTPLGKTRTARTNSKDPLATYPSLRQDNAPDLTRKPSLASFNFLTPTAVPKNHISYYYYCFKSESGLWCGL